MPSVFLRQRARFFRWAPAFCLAGLCSAACSGTGKLVLGEVTPGGAGGTIGGAGGAWINTDASLPTDDASCASADLQFSYTPALYLIADRSNNMQFNFQQQQGSKWLDLVDGLDSYLTSDSGKQWNVGLGLFPNQCQFRQPPKDCSNGALQSCNSPAYGEVNVAVGPSVNVASFLNQLVTPQLGPGGPAGLRIALDGALQTIIPAWERLNPMQFVVPVVLVTNIPNQSDCPPNSINAITNVVDDSQRDAGANAHSRTYVIGFEVDNGGNNGGNNFFDQIARAGGTDNAYIIDNDRPPVNSQLTNALDEIRRRSCMFQLPPNFQGALALVTPADGGAHPDILLRVDNAMDCGQRQDRGFEFYYDPSDSSRVIGCDATCEALYDTLPQGGKVQLISKECLILQPPMR